MKKLLAVFLSLVMMLTLIPYGVSAAEVEDSRETDLITKAADVFPEYADKLLNPRSRVATHSGNPTPRVLVVEKTRSVSDKESITYTEYSDGCILLRDDYCVYESEALYSDDENPEFNEDSTVVSSDKGSFYKRYTINVTATCIGPYGGRTGYFYLDGVSYTILNGLVNYDSITNPGTARKGANCDYANRTVYERTEFDRGYARVAYNLTFRIGSGSGDVLHSVLAVSVGEDSATISHAGL